MLLSLTKERIQVNLYLLLCIACLFLVSCVDQQRADKETQAKYLSPEKVVLPSYAKGFSLEDYGTFQVLHILQPFSDQTDTLSYFLAPSSVKAPAPFQHLAKIKTPVTKMVVQSTTHVGLAAAIGVQTTIVGMTSTDYVYHEALRKAIKAGEIVNVGEGEQLDHERIMTMQPDVMIISGFSAASYQKNYKGLLDVGIPVLVNTEWTEQSMLARAEWLKVMGYLTGRAEEASTAFNDIERHYLDYAKIGRAAAEKPAVIGGLPYKGSWSVAGAKSYVAKLLTDAGATWNWSKDTSSVSLQMDFESVYPFGLQADYWLRVGGVKSKAELLAVDKRLGDFKAFKSGQLYNNNKRMTPDGMGNDYWESGIVNPHLILADIITIIHPDLLPDHELMYYEQLEQE